MADRVIKPDSGNDLVIEDAGSTDRLRITDGGSTILYEDGGAAALTIDTDGFIGFGFTPSSSKKFAVKDGNINGSSTPGGGALYFDNSNDRLVYHSSSKRYKNNIRNIETDTSKIYEIGCKTFETNDPDQLEVKTGFGLIAEDVVEFFPTLIGFDKQDRPDSLNYAMLGVPIIAELQKLNEKVNSLQNA